MKFHRFGTILPFFGPKNGPSKELQTLNFSLVINNTLMMSKNIFDVYCNLFKGQMLYFWTTAE